MSSNKKKWQGPKPAIRPDLSNESSALVTYHGTNTAAIVTYDDQKSSSDRKPNHKDKYSIATSHLAIATQSPPRPTLSTPLQIANSFSPLRSDSSSFKTVASSLISPHSAKQDKLIEKQKTYAPSTSSSFPKINNPTYHYHEKPYFDKFFVVETPLLLETYFKEPKKLADAIIDPMFCRIPEDNLKRHIFYEFILVDTDSIYISDVFDKIDTKKLIFRKIKFCKIITLEQWGNDPNKKRTFSRPFHISEFSYWDYIDAWTYVFYGQNPGNSLSWFIYFDKDFPLNIPFWFLEWWDKYGPNIDFLPTIIKEGYQYWVTHIDKPKDWDFIPDLLIFFRIFSLTWILMLDYKIQERLIGNVNVPYFGRQTKIKWWSGMNMADHGKSRVAKWFNENPSLCNANTDQSQFLMAKSQNQAKIAAARTPEELLAIADEMRKTMSAMSQKDSDSDDCDDFLSEDDNTEGNSYQNTFGHDLSQFQGH